MAKIFIGKQYSFHGERVTVVRKNKLPFAYETFTLRMADGSFTDVRCTSFRKLVGN